MTRRGRTTSVNWEATSEKAEVEFYCLGKGHSVGSFLRVAALQYMARYALNEVETARARLVLEEREKSRPGAMPVQAKVDE